VHFQKKINMVHKRRKVAYKKKIVLVLETLTFTYIFIFLVLCKVIVYYDLANSAPKWSALIMDLINQQHIF
jgi:hypothetical protein